MAPPFVAAQFPMDRSLAVRETSVEVFNVLATTRSPSNICPVLATRKQPGDRNPPQGPCDPVGTQPMALD